jgi:hypothetical protein
VKSRAKSAKPQQHANIPLLPPITLEQCVAVVRSCSEDFAEVCAVDAKYTSHSWWVRGIAQILSESGCSVMTDLRDHSFRNHLGNFCYAVKSDFPSGIDVLACQNWSHHQVGEEEYGKDEPYLPAFHAVRIFSGRKAYSEKKEDWAYFFELGNSIAGPLTMSIVGIDVFEGGEGYWVAADHFRREMERLRVTCDVSTKEMRPGVFASVTVLEPADPFQILVASKVMERGAIENPEYVASGRRLRTSRLRGNNDP